ncbi:MAG: hypothetical protein CVV57_06170 [Tenericutes bacterium HGW-Tenericutes-2]|jgi:hypothetical protein|nr:MAG: hypothetical protein CVV57_06170 [Tenericutes bacterium HGW-Tenericutes-2]
MHKRKKRLIVISIILFFWLVMLSTDMILAERDHAPVFYARVVSYDDGGSEKFIGLFYQVYHVKSIDPSNSDLIIDYGYHLVPWFYSLDYVKEIVVHDT